MSKTNIRINGFDIVRRHDNSIAVYDYGWWPDADLDADPDLNAAYLEATGGYRKKGWQIVRIFHSLREACNWARYGDNLGSLPSEVSVAT